MLLKCVLKKPKTKDYNYKPYLNPGSLYSSKKPEQHYQRGSVWDFKKVVDIHQLSNSHITKLALIYLGSWLFMWGNDDNNNCQLREVF